MQTESAPRRCQAQVSSRKFLRIGKIQAGRRKQSGGVMLHTSPSPRHATRPRLPRRMRGWTSLSFDATDRPQNSAEDLAMSEAVVIIGAGQAGAQLAQSLRQGGHAGPVRLICDEG